MKIKRFVKCVLFTASVILSFSTTFAAVTDADWEQVAKLIEAGKKPEAVSKLDELIKANPDNQKLKDQRARLVPSLSISSPAQGNTATTMNDEDRLEANTLSRLMTKIRDSSDPAEQRKLREQVLERSAPLVQKYPKEMNLWLMRARAALALDKPREGWDAGKNLKSLGALSSTEQSVGDVMAELNLKKWLVADLDSVEREVAAKRKAETEAASLKRLARWTGTYKAQGRFPFGSSRPGGTSNRGETTLSCSVSINLSEKSDLQVFINADGNCRNVSYDRDGSELSTARSSFHFNFPGAWDTYDSGSETSRESGQQKLESATLQPDDEALNVRGNGDKDRNNAIITLGLSNNGEELFILGYPGIYSVWQCAKLPDGQGKVRDMISWLEQQQNGLEPLHGDKIGNVIFFSLKRTSGPLSP